MKSRRAKLGLALLAAVCLILLVIARQSLSGRVKRTPFGDPDLQGIWSNVSMTKLERRGRATTPFISPESAQAAKSKYLKMMKTDDFFPVLLPSWAEKKRPQRPAGPDGKPKGKGGRLMLGYNSFWWDSAVGLSETEEGFRTAWIVDPEDGLVPYSDFGKSELAKRIREKGSADNPEQRNVGERCLLGFGSVSGPPMLNVEYNSNYQIYQSPGHVVILSEMIQDARIIRIGGERLPPGMKTWMGESIGRWDGDTLVVETFQRHPAQQFIAENNNLIFTTDDTKITEKFRRVSDTEISYEFVMEDAKAYTQPWRAQMPLRAIRGPLFEFACHEGNRSMENILGGGRQEDRQRKLSEEEM